MITTPIALLWGLIGPKQSLITTGSQHHYFYYNLKSWQTPFICSIGSLVLPVGQVVNQLGQNWRVL